MKNNMKELKIQIEVKEINHDLKEIRYYTDILQFYCEKDMPFELAAEAKIEEYLMNKKNETGYDYEIVSIKKI